MTRLSPEREAKIRERVADLSKRGLAPLDVRDLLAEIDALREKRNILRMTLRSMIAINAPASFFHDMAIAALLDTAEKE